MGSENGDQRGSAALVDEPRQGGGTPRQAGVDQFEICGRLQMAIRYALQMILRLLPLFLLPVAFTAQDGEKEQPRKEGDLGFQTRAPTIEEARNRGLPVDVRVQGQVIESLKAGGPADEAGLAKGDVILKLNENRLYSRDHLEDFLRVTLPGTTVTATVRRAGADKDTELKVVLGERESKERRILWQYASLEQLGEALHRAKKDGRNVLVGISGAET